MQERYYCPPCLRERVFDGVRDDPRFVAIHEELQSQIEAQRQRLKDEGMLLTPEELTKKENFDFDPFVS